MFSSLHNIDGLEGWPAKPQGEAVGIVKDGNGFTISAGHAPRGSVPLLYFSVGAMAFGLILLASYLLFAKFSADIAKEPAKYFMFPLFWVLGLPASLAAMYWGIRMAFSSSLFAVTRGNLIYRRRGPLGSREISWELAEVGKIDVGSSLWFTTSKNAGGNTLPMNALFVKSANGKSTEMLTAHELSELQWIQASLRKAIDIATRGIQA